MGKGMPIIVDCNDHSVNLMGIDLTFESLIPPQGSKLNEMDSSVSSNMALDSATSIIWKRIERKGDLNKIY